MKNKNNPAVYFNGQRMGVAHYLMSAYLYEHEEENILTDHDYDALWRWIEEHRSSIEHMHLHIVPTGMSSAIGLGFPLRVQSAARSWWRMHNNNKPFPERDDK